MKWQKRKEQSGDEIDHSFIYTVSLIQTDNVLE